ncbi:MAG: hypothetical protein CVV48_10360 [Spirochaetae bacterium HGW-Spirochaetae-4]|nr:MAG: hypothetical protein CVV48_10360 [Spirochaetae bacterium HGW-Spirochaetae-4]
MYSKSLPLTSFALDFKKTSALEYFTEGKSTYMGNNNKGGQLARNFRSGQIAEGLAFDLCRPFMAMARIEQEEDFGIDFIGTLLRKSTQTYTAEQSCMIQAKISSSARFHIKGLGVNWLRQLVLPYFPIVIDRDQSKAFLYTLNDFHYIIHLSFVNEYVFVLEEDMENDPCDSFFSLGDPVMSWDIHESAHPDFCTWAYSVLKPVIEIETLNQRYATIGRFEKLFGRNYKFTERDDKNLAVNPPRRDSVSYHYSGNNEGTKSNLVASLTPFAHTVASTGYAENRSEDLEKLVMILSRLGVEVDHPRLWREIIEDMKSYEK